MARKPQPSPVRLRAGDEAALAALARDLGVSTPEAARDLRSAVIRAGVEAVRAERAKEATT